MPSFIRHDAKEQQTLNFTVFVLKAFSLHVEHSTRHKLHSKVRRCPQFQTDIIGQESYVFFWPHIPARAATLMSKSACLSDAVQPECRGVQWLLRTVPCHP